MVSKYMFSYGYWHFSGQFDQATQISLDMTIWKVAWGSTEMWRLGILYVILTKTILFKRNLTKGHHTNNTTKKAWVLDPQHALQKLTKYTKLFGHFHSYTSKCMQCKGPTITHSLIFVRVAVYVNISWRGVKIDPSCCLAMRFHINGSSSVYSQHNHSKGNHWITNKVAACISCIWNTGCFILASVVVV